MRKKKRKIRMGLEHKCDLDGCSNLAVSCFYIFDKSTGVVDSKFSCPEHESELLAGLKKKYTHLGYTYAKVDVSQKLET